MDVEDAEWESFVSKLKTVILQCRVRPFGFQVHYVGHTHTAAEFYRRWKILQHLEDIGFRRW